MVSLTNLGTIVCEKYQITKEIGNGSYGICYEGLDIKTGDKVAIKIESNSKAHKSSLESEVKNYKYYLQHISGIPKLYWFGSDQNIRHIMVIELLGPNLENLFNYCSRKFSFKTILMIVIQILERLQSIHSKNLIHRDVKPENFLIGYGTQSYQIYVIDFGLSKCFIDKDTKNHIKFEKNVGITGTPRYCSINANKGYEQSRRDDLESLSYMLSYFNRGRLPWQGFNNTYKCKTQAILQVKRSTTFKQLFDGMDEVFAQFLEYTRNLKFNELPDYYYWINQFEDLFNRMGYIRDYKYDWILLMKNQTSDPP